MSTRPGSSWGACAPYALAIPVLLLLACGADPVPGAGGVGAGGAGSGGAGAGGAGASGGGVSGQAGAGARGSAGAGNIGGGSAGAGNAGGGSAGAGNTGGGSAGAGNTGGGSAGSGGSGTGGAGAGGAGDGGLTYRRANLTNFTSYPDPGSEECVEFNGCMWAGQFAFVEGQQPESWVMSHNIAAVHSRDAGTYQRKTLRLRKDGRQIDVTVYDMCADSDCSGCCTANSRETGFLIDIEKYTAERFGVGDGIVEWACVDC